jgi:Zn-finger nucleic acid-binding protein
MTSYNQDRAFTDYIHKYIAIPKIYKSIGWQEANLEKNYAEKMDMQLGIDYVFIDQNGELKTVQERFRESKYQQYSDFTVRYRRDENLHASRRESEYYKMKADYFTYGITNCLKFNINQCTDFIKYAVIDLRKVYEKIDNGLIIIRDNGKNTCEIIENKIVCPVKYNHDGSSSFFPIEIKFLVQLWGNEIIIAQKGFL